MRFPELVYRKVEESKLVCYTLTLDDVAVDRFVMIDEPPFALCRFSKTKGGFLLLVFLGRAVCQ